MVEIKGKTANEVWRKLLASIMKNGESYLDRRNRICKEALNVVATIESVEGITKPIETINKLNKWVYPIEEQIKNFILNKEDSSEYYYNYGERAFNFEGINQVDEYIIPLLKKTPTSKRAIVMFYSTKDSLPLRKEVPGLVSINFEIRNNQLHSTLIIRSNDMFHGWPGNVAQAYYLTEYVANELNCKIGSITTFSISAHIFEEQFDDIKKILKK